jgi:hypothetical protein
MDAPLSAVAVSSHSKVNQRRLYFSFSSFSTISSSRFWRWDAAVFGDL